MKKRTKNKIKHRLWVITIKYPVMMIICALLMYICSYYIAINTQVGVYKKVIGTILIQENNRNEAKIIFDLDGKEQSNLNKNDSIIWYTKNGSQRFKGYIREIGHNNMKIEAIPNKADFDMIFSKEGRKNNLEVVVEVMVGKQNIINKIITEKFNTQ